MASAGCTMVEMPGKKLPPDVIEWFRKMGAKGGNKGGSAGGKTAAAKMTAKNRQARAKGALVMREAKRRAKRKTGDKTPFFLVVSKFARCRDLRRCSPIAC